MFPFKVEPYKKRILPDNGILKGNELMRYFKIHLDPVNALS